MTQPILVPEPTTLENQQHVIEEILIVPANITSLLESLWASDLWLAISKMMSPIEYLLIQINIAILADSYVSYDFYRRAANIMQATDTMFAVDFMQDLQLLVILFFAIELSLTASRSINFQIDDEQCAPEIAEKPINSISHVPLQFTNAAQTVRLAKKQTRTLTKQVKTKKTPSRPSDEKSDPGSIKSRYFKSPAQPKELDQLYLDSLTTNARLVIRITLVTANLAAIAIAVLTLEL